MSLDVWHQYKFTPFNMFDDESDVVQETVKATPLSRKSLNPQFDTVIILDMDEAESTAVQGNKFSALVSSDVDVPSQDVEWAGFISSFVFHKL